MSNATNRRGRKYGKLAGGFLCGTSLASLMLLALPTMAQAQDQDRHWDENQTALGTGGTGTWDTASNLWSPNDDGVSGPFVAPWDNAALDNAIFGGTAGTVTLGSPITVHNLTFNTANYILTGNTLTLAGVTPTISNNGNLTIQSVIAGSSGLTKIGGGNLSLAGVNTFTGGIYLNQGGIVASSDAALGAASNIINIADGASVRLSIGGADTSREIRFGNDGLVTLGGSGVGSALITGNGRVSVGNSVTLSNDASTYTGSTTFNGLNGVAYNYFTSIADLGVASSLGAPVTVSDGTIVFNQSSQYSDNVIYLGDGDSSNRNWELYGAAAIIRNRGTGTLSITGNILTSGSSNFIAETADIELLGTLSGGNYSFGTNAGRTLTLGGANTYTGTSVIGGLVKASVLANGGVASSLGAGAGASLNAGTLSYTGTGSASNRTWEVSGASGILNDGTGALNLTGNATFLPGNPVDSLTLGGSFAGENTFSGVLSGAGALTSSGNGTWVLGGANTFTGSVTVNAGTLRAGNASAFGTPTGLIVNGGTLDLGGYDLLAPSLSGTGGFVALGASNLTVNATSAQTFEGSITGTGGLSKTGAGTLTLTGASSYTGATTIGGGKLALDFSGAGSPANNIISASSPLVLTGGVLEVLGADGATNSQSFNGLNVTAGSNRIAATSGAGGTTTINFGTITRTGGLVDFALPASGTFNTTSTILGGWATVNGTDYAKVDGGNIVAFTAADYANKDDAADWLTGDIVSDVGGTAGTPFFGAVTGSQALGGLKYTAAADSAVTIGAGQTLGIDGTIIVASSVGGSNQIISGGSLTGGTGGGSLGILHNGEGLFRIESTVIDNGGATTGFTKGGDGDVSLVALNSYTGVTTLSGGTLRINRLANSGQASSIGAASADASNLVLESGTLSYLGSTDTSTDRGFTLVNGGASAPTIFVLNSRTIGFSGLVTSPDDAGLSKTGQGTLVLSNDANDYVGITTVSGGTLSVDTLADGGAASGIGAASSDASNLVLRDGGRLQYTGGTTSIDRGFTVAAGQGRIDVAQAASTLTMSGPVVGVSGTTFVKDGTGTLVLTGTNTDFLGDTIVTAGTLRAGSAQAFGPGLRYMTVQTGADLDLGGFDISVGGIAGGGTISLGANTLTSAGGSAVFTGTITGTGGFTRGPGSYTQTLSGCNNTYTGVTTVSGSLSVDCIANGGVASSIGASSADSANLVLNGDWLNYTGASVTTDRGFTAGASSAYLNVTQAGTTLEFTGAAVGTGGLNKDGAGTLVLSGANSYAGGTTIREGTLRAGSSQAFGAPSAMILSNNSGAILDLAGYDTSVAYLELGLGGTVNLGGATLTITTGKSSATSYFAGAIDGTGALVKNGNLLQNLTGCDSSYTGSTTINGGVLAAACLTDGGMASSIGASGADADNLVLNGGTLRYIGTGGSTNRLFTLGASGGNTLEASGTGAIIFTSTAPLTFSSPNTAQTLTLGGTNTGDNILAAQITNNGTGLTALTKTGTGTWILANPASSYTGVTTINGGVLGVDKLSNGGVASSIGMSSADASNLVIGNGSTLRYTGTGDTTNRLFTLAAGVSFIESSGTGAVVFTDTGPVTLQGNDQSRVIALGGANTGNNTLAGSIGDAGTGVTTLAKNDSGTWILTGDHSYSGSTNVNGGILSIGGGGTTGSIASATVNNFGTLAFDRSDSLTFGGAIVGTGGVQQNGTGTTILTGTSTYTGGTTINAGILQLGDGGATGSIVGDVANDGVLAFNRSNLYTFGGVISGGGSVTQDGAGTTVLSGTNSYTGGTLINEGTLQISSDANLGDAAGDVTINNGTLHATAGMTIDRAVTLTGAATLSVTPGVAFTVNDVIDGAGSLTKAGGLVILNGDNTYTGGTTITEGTLQIGLGGTTGSIVGDVVNNAALVFNRADALTYAGTISGTGQFTKAGTGTMTLTGDSTYAGTTRVAAGTLLINGDQSGATGLTTVLSGATLGGMGTIGGDVFVDNGGILAPGESPGTLTIAGDLSLVGGSILNFEFGEADVVGGALNDLVNVGGDLVLDGTINVTETAGGTFGGGIYRVFNYGGALTDNGLALGTMPGGSSVTVQTAVAGQVNLVNSAGLELSFWDGDAGPKFNDVVNGGNGVWHLGGVDNNWTDAFGGVNAAYADGTFAIFAGTGGAVTVDNTGGAVTATGMQFASDGYTITGDALTLVGPESTIRVGDGTALGADFTATIGADLTGTTQLVKTDLGTLVLAGINTYTGGTAINEGTLQIASDANLGDAAGAVTIDSGTLQTIADLTTSRAITLDGAGTLLTGAGTNFTVTGAIDGAGSLTKDGTGTLTLTAANTYADGTTIADGILQLGDGGTSGSIVGDVVNNGVLAFNRSDDVTFAGVISGAGNVVQNGAGTTDLTGISTYTGNTTVNAGELRLADGGQVTSTLQILVGRNLGENGTITVDGPGSTLNITGTGVVRSGLGGDGTGTLNIIDGGAVTGGVITLGAGDAGQGTLNVSGAGSSYTTTATGASNLAMWQVGSSGAGIVNVTAGGLIENSGNVRFGALGGEGTATVSGDGSTWDIGGALQLVKGSLSVLDGGVVHTDSANIGFTPVYIGDTNVLVSGAGSRLETTGAFRLNASSAGRTGVLTIADGGAVSVGGGTLAITGGNTMLNIGGVEGAAATAAGSLEAASVTMANATSRVNFNHTDTAYLFDAAISGAGAVNQTGSGTTILTAANTYTGGTTITSGALQLGDGGTSGSIAGDVANDGALIFNRSDDVTFAGLISGAGEVEQAGTGTTVLTAANSYTGGTAISAGALQLGDGGTTGSIVGDVANEGVLAFNRSDSVTFGGLISGTGSVDQLGAGTTILTGDNSYTGGTTITAGTLQLGDGGTSGSIVGNVANAGLLAFNRSDELTFAGVISGAGDVNQNGAGITILTGSNTYTGATNVNAGMLIVNGDQSGATGLTTVNTGAALGGIGMIGGDVTVADGGVINPGDVGLAPGALGIAGNLGLAATATLDYNFGQADVVGGPLNDLINVGGDLTLDGTLNVNTSAGGVMDVGVYRVINYAGGLTNNGLALGTVPSADFYVQISIPGQVNLVNTSGVTLRFWDGDTIASKNSGTIEGGNGLWQSGLLNDNWTEDTGALNAPFSDGDFAVFMGAAGTVTVDTNLGPVNASGMQFLTDGYVIDGDAINLVGAPASTIRVGDGTAAGTGITATIASELSGTAQLVKSDLGTLVLTGANTYTGGTAINGGTLQIASDANLGDAADGLSFNGGSTLNTTADIITARAVDLVGDGNFLIDTGTTLALNGAIAGAGGFIKSGAGTLILTADNSYTGATNVNAGMLFVNGDQLGATGLTTVLSGAALGGIGTIGGDVFVDNGGTLAPGESAGTLTIAGDLSLVGGSILNFEFGEAGVVGGALNDLVNVGGGLTLDGTINVTVPTGGSFGPGIYRVFNYGGILTNNGLELGTMPLGSIAVQTAINGQVNLVNTAGLTLSFWDGSPGPKNNGVVDGGDGTWLVGGGNNDWTDMNGSVNADYAQDSFAIFSATGGTVSIDNSGGNVLASGMQFASDGYVLNGDALTLTGTDAIIQVGDGTAAGAGYTTTINAELTGAAQLVKTDAGTLVLSGANSYTGGTSINGGTLQVSSDVNLGDAAGGISFDGGMLNTTADMATGRTIDLVGAGTFLTGAGTTLDLSGVISGAGSLSKAGAGTLILTAASSYTGGTTIDAGILQLGNGGTTGSIIGDVVNDSTLAFNRSDDIIFGGTISGSGAVNQIGTGATILTANSSYTGGTTISTGTLQLGNGGTTGSILGDVVNNGTLAFNRSNNVTFAGLISGNGSLEQIGVGTTILTGGNSYTDATNVNAGTLLVNGDQSAATGLTSVVSGATLGGTGTIGGNVALADGAILTPGAGGAGTLTIAGDLSLSSGSLLAFEYGEADVAGGALNDLVTVGGDLTLDGTINVAATAGGAFGAGVYRVFDYDGALIDNGLSLGMLPADSSVIVQTAISGQVNLVNSAGLALNFWDGSAGPKFDGTVNGGDGVWQNATGNDNWTDAAGDLNAAYSDGSFAVFGGTGGTVTVDNSLGAVTSGGMQFASDGYTIAGDELALTDPITTIRVGDGSTAGADYTAVIDTVLAGDSQIVKTDAGTLVLSGTNSYTGGTAINGDILQVSADANLGDAAGGLTLNGGTLATSADMSSERDMVLGGAGTIATAGDTTFTFDGVFSGTGALTKQGMGTLLLTGDSSGYTADTIVATGTLAVDGVVGGAVTVNGGALLTGNGQVGNVSNAGVIAPGREDGFGALTVGSYTGNGGVLEIETVFGGDSSQTDQLVVSGGTSGSTEVVVTNRGGLGEQTVEGIKIIDVTDGASDGDFMLRGDYLFEGETAIIAGAYGYRLNQGGVSTPTDGDWYLRSALLDGSGEPDGPLYQPGVPLYENYGQTLQALNNLPTLQERVGNRRWASTESGASNGIWGRMENTRFRPGASVSTAATDANIDSWKLQTGYDRALIDDGGGMLIAGVTGHYGEANATVRSMFGDGTIKTKSYGVGATLTWYDHDGFYADAQAQFAWFEGELNSSVLGTLADDNDGKGQAFGLEVGKRSVVGDGLTLTPQIQMTYQNVEFDTFTDPSEAVVSSSRGDSLKTRWGMSIDHQKVWETSGANRRSHIYGGLNLSYEWLDGTQADVSGTPIRNANDRLWGEAALGCSLGLNDSVTIYTQVSASSPFRNFGEDYSFKGVAGIRLAF